MLLNLAIELSCLILSLHTFSFHKKLFSPFKYNLDLYITDTVLKVSRSLYCLTTSISHDVENYFPRLCGTGISDATSFTVRQWTIKATYISIQTCMKLSSSFLIYFVYVYNSKDHIGIGHQ